MPAVCSDLVSGGGVMQRVFCKLKAWIFKLGDIKVQNICTFEH